MVNCKEINKHADSWDDILFIVGEQSWHGGLVVPGVELSQNLPLRLQFSLRGSLIIPTLLKIHMFLVSITLFTLHHSKSAPLGIRTKLQNII